MWFPLSVTVLSPCARPRRDRVDTGRDGVGHRDRPGEAAEIETVTVFEPSPPSTTTPLPDVAVIWMVSSPGPPLIVVLSPGSTIVSLPAPPLIVTCWIPEYSTDCSVQSLKMGSSPNTKPDVRS